jgi:Na+-transporting methylmalonyl-CoA/oxaloacetate decarboxylase gamma subunit
MNSSYTTMDAIGDIFVIYGIVIVVSMLVAVVIRGIVWALSRQTTVPTPAPVAKPAALPQPAIVGIPQEHLAVITAAVAAMFSAHRIVHIEAATRGYSWTSEARSVHHTSHAPRASR